MLRDIGVLLAIIRKNPANIAFDDSRGRIVVTNQADYVQVTDPSDYWAVFDVYVDDTTGWLFGDQPGIFCRDECLNLL